MPLKNAYAKGVRREKASRKFLEEHGYFVIEARGSHGLWDLVAISTRDVVLVQVKSNKKPSPAELEKLEDFKVPYDIRKLVHIWHDGGRLEEIEL